MVVLLAGSPISVLVAIWSGPSPPIAQFGRAATSRKSLGGYKLLPFNPCVVLRVKNDPLLCLTAEKTPYMIFFQLEIS